MPALITTEHFKAALKKVLPSTQKGSPCTTDFDAVNWNDIGGLEKVKLKIQQVSKDRLCMQILLYCYLDSG